ncbi:MAG: type II toxin-antitoxin system RelE/ParE family toxin [bacterium]
MANYRVEIKRSALRELKRLQPRVRRRAERFIDSLAANPTPDGAKKMSGRENRWRREFTEGYRIIYEVHRGRLVVLILKIGPRGDVYK